MEVFALLAEPVRRRIIEILATGEHSSTNVPDVLHQEFGVSHSAVSRHLRILARSDFAVARADGPYRFYRLNADALEQLDLAVDHLHELWDARYGYPYFADPTAPERIVGHPKHAGESRRGRRGRSTLPVVFEINHDNNPWQWVGD
jgi:DNA-binding transcriptional ArsR family regulator